MAPPSSIANAEPMDSDWLTRIDKLIVRMLGLVERQQAIVLALKANGQDASGAEELLEVLRDGVDALHVTREAVSRWIEG